MHPQTCSVCLEERDDIIQCCKGPGKAGGDVACVNCTKAYLLQSKDTARCMFCKTHWDRLFLFRHFSDSFTKNIYRKFEEDLFLEREKTLLPRYEVYSKIDLLEQEENRCANSPYLKQYSTFLKKAQVVDSPEIKKHYDKMKNILQNYINHIQIKIEKLKQELNIETRKEPVRKCFNSDCSGVLSNWKCVICKTSFCVDCFEKMENNHKCDTNTLKTMKLLNKNTKPCPKCFVPIQKDGGCDQMYCVYCDVSFYWSTGTINNGVIHNPEYFRKMRDKGIEIKNNRCVDDPDFMDHEIQEYISHLDLEYYVTYCIFRSTLELIDIQPKILNGEEIDTTKLKKSAINFIRGEIDEKEWKRLIYCSYRGREFYLGLNRIGRMYHEMCIHLYLEYRPDKSKYVEEMKTLAKDMVKDVKDWCLFIGRKIPSSYNFEQLIKSS